MERPTHYSDTPHLQPESHSTLRAVELGALRDPKDSLNNIGLTILDLAIRGDIQITLLKRENSYKPQDILLGQSLRGCINLKT